MAQTWQDISFTSQDGLRLAARYYAAPNGGGRRPVLCLPGLAGSNRDFHSLALYLTDPRNPHGRDVLAIDSRGRGGSQWCNDAQAYTLELEMRDALDLLTIAGMFDVGVVGTCRGGLVAMMMSCLHPGAIGAVVLNDAGPVIEREGLLRMLAIIGKMPLPSTWAEARQIVRDLSERAFSAIPEELWDDIARQWFIDDEGRPTPGHDPALASSMPLIEGPLPTLWPQFKALSLKPLMAIRGEHSDYLSAATAAEMRLHHPAMTALTVRGQGHSPYLRDTPTLAAIDDFLVRADTGVAAQRDAPRLIA